MRVRVKSKRPCGTTKTNASGAWEKHTTTNASGDWWDWPGKPASCLRREAEQADVGSFVVVKDEPQEEVKEQPQEAAGYDEIAMQACLESGHDADSYGWDNATYWGQLQNALIGLNTKAFHVDLKMRLVSIVGSRAHACVE